MAGNETGGEARKENRSRNFIGALVVIAALAAAVVSLSLILDNFEGSGQTAAATAPAGGGEAAATSTPADNASVSASSVVAILTPTIAGILGIAGLFFSVSATGSARGREADAKIGEADAEKVRAEANADKLKAEADAEKLKAAAEAEKLKAAAEAEKAKADAEAEKLKAEAEKTAADAERTMADLEAQDDTSGGGSSTPGTGGL